MPTICGTVSLGSWPSSSIGEDSAVEVTFGRALDDVPQLAVQLAGIDAASPFSKRVEVWASDETRAGFRLHVRTWGDSVTYSVKISWVATTESSLVRLDMLPLEGQPDSPISCMEEHRVSFASPLARPPDVACGLAGIDAPGDEHLRVWAQGVDAGREQLALRCGTWASSTARSLKTSWIASASPRELQCGSLQMGAWPDDAIQGGVDKYVDVSFREAFDDTPDIALALAGIDADCRKPARIDTWADCVGKEGFRLHVKSWEDSVTWRVNVSWVATASAPSHTVSHFPPHQPPARYVADETPLGQGWWGVTHRARRLAGGGVFAVKTCRHPFKQHEQMLRQELDNLMRLPVHPNLLRYHEFIIHADRLHIVTEYLDAFKLTELVPGPEGTCTRHAPSLVLTWIAELCDGLAHLHAAGIVHRDLHGDNVLVERDADRLPSSGPRAVRIIDFGAAGFLGDTTKPRLMSHEAGCCQYFSPERRKGLAFGDRDDVWAVGCHLTELVSGRRISAREGCGVGGLDFATSPAQIEDAIRSCECGTGRCRALAASILVHDAGWRPAAAAVRDAVKLALRCVPERKRKFPGPSGGGRARRQRRRCSGAMLPVG